MKLKRSLIGRMGVMRFWDRRLKWCHLSCHCWQHILACSSQTSTRVASEDDGFRCFEQLCCSMGRDKAQSLKSNPISSRPTAPLKAKNVQLIVFIGRSECNFVRWVAFSRSRYAKLWNNPKQWFQNDFNLVNLFLNIPGSWEPVYMRHSCVWACLQWRGLTVETGASTDRVLDVVYGN